MGFFKKTMKDSADLLVLLVVAILTPPMFIPMIWFDNLKLRKNNEKIVGELQQNKLLQPLVGYARVLRVKFTFATKPLEQEQLYHWSIETQWWQRSEEILPIYKRYMDWLARKLHYYEHCNVIIYIGRAKKDQKIQPVDADERAWVLAHELGHLRAETCLPMATYRCESQPNPSCLKKEILASFAGISILRELHYFHDSNAPTLTEDVLKHIIGRDDCKECLTNPTCIASIGKIPAVSLDGMLFTWNPEACGIKEPQ